VSGPKTTPADLLTPSAVTNECETALPSKYTFALVVRVTFCMVVVGIAEAWGLCLRK
jgi:hypothetical protein